MNEGARREIEKPKPQGSIVTQSLEAAPSLLITHVLLPLVGAVIGVVLADASAGASFMGAPVLVGTVAWFWYFRWFRTWVTLLFAVTASVCCVTLMVPVLVVVLFLAW
jgi:hypothetical protein